MSTTSNPDTLRNAPPPKNPYFRLPDTKFLALQAPPTPPPTPPPTVKPGSKSTPVKDKVKALTLSQIFGVLAKMSDDSQAEFLMRLISHSKFEPDFLKMAKELGVKGKKGVQERFQGLAKKHGFDVDKENQIKSKPFDPKKDIQPVVNNTKVAKEKSAIIDKAPKVKLKMSAKPKEKTKRPTREGEAKVKKAKTKSGTKGPGSDAPKLARKKKIAKKAIEADQSKLDANANVVEQPKVLGPVDETPLAQISMAATVDEVEDVEMGGVRQVADALEGPAGDI